MKNAEKKFLTAKRNMNILIQSCLLQELCNYVRTFFWKNITYINLAS